MNETSIFTESELDNVGVTIQTDWTVGDDHYVIAGYQAHLDDLEQERLRSVISNGVPADPTFIREEASRDSHSLFVQDEWSIDNNWRVTAGARGFWVDSELEETTREDFTPSDNSDSDVVGSVGVSYLGVKDTTFWSRWAQGYLYPTLSQTATGAFAGPNYVNPNADLIPETSDTFDLGARFDDGEFAFDVSAYVTLSEDFIDFVTCEESDVVCLSDETRSPRVYINADRAKSFGLEASASWKLDQLEPYIDVAWRRRKTTIAGFSTYESGLPTVLSRAGLKYEDSLLGNTAWIDAYTRMSSDSSEREGLSDVEDRAGWATANLSFGLNIGEKDQVKVVLDLINLFDKRYIPATENLVAPGRAALVRIGVDL